MRLLSSIFGIFVFFALFTSAPAFAAGDPECDVCKICDDRVLVSLADNVFQGSVQDAVLLECTDTSCKSLSILDDGATVPKYAGQWESIVLSHSPSVLYRFVELAFCDVPGCSESERAYITLPLANCDL